MSKIPHISLVAFFPGDTIKNGDTCYVEFKFTDGDGDISNDTNSAVFARDTRFDTGFQKNLFPAITPATIEDPKNGLSGTVLFMPIPIAVLRADSLHQATGDTLSYEIYITDRAGHQSNHITTSRVIITP